MRVQCDTGIKFCKSFSCMIKQAKIWDIIGCLVKCYFKHMDTLVNQNDYGVIDTINYLVMEGRTIVFRSSETDVKEVGDLFSTMVKYRFLNSSPNIRKFSTTSL